MLTEAVRTRMVEWSRVSWWSEWSRVSRWSEDPYGGLVQGLTVVFSPAAQTHVDLEVLRRRLSNAPRPLKKRSSITEPEGPQGPHIQKLLYQRSCYIQYIFYMLYTV